MKYLKDFKLFENNQEIIEDDIKDTIEYKQLDSLLTRLSKSKTSFENLQNSLKGTPPCGEMSSHFWKKFKFDKFWYIEDFSWVIYFKDDNNKSRHSSLLLLPKRVLSGIYENILSKTDIKGVMKKINESNNEKRYSNELNKILDIVSKNKTSLKNLEKTISSNKKINKNTAFKNHLFNGFEKSTDMGWSVKLTFNGNDKSFDQPIPLCLTDNEYCKDLYDIIFSYINVNKVFKSINK